MTNEPSQPGEDAPLLRAWARFEAGTSTPFTIPGPPPPRQHRVRRARAAARGRCPAVRRPRRHQDRGQRPRRRRTVGRRAVGSRLVPLFHGRLDAREPGRRARRRATRRHGSGVACGASQHVCPVSCSPAFDRCGCLPRSTNGSASRSECRPPPSNERSRSIPRPWPLFCVEPGYLGTLSDLPAIIALAHARGVPVVVDQAWGAHLGFHPGYPQHALALGADAMVLSAHKTLPGLQPGFGRRGVHPSGSTLTASTARSRCRATTSPSGTIHASTDAARALLASPLARDLLDRLAQRHRRGPAAAAGRDPGTAHAGTGRLRTRALRPGQARAAGRRLWPRRQRARAGLDRGRDAGRARRPRHPRTHRHDARRRCGGDRPRRPRGRRGRPGSPAPRGHAPCSPPGRRASRWPS